MKKFKTMSEIDLLYYAYWQLLDESRRNEDKLIKFPTNVIFKGYSVKLQAKIDEISAEITKSCFPLSTKRQSSESIRLCLTTGGSVNEIGMIRVWEIGL